MLACVFFFKQKTAYEMRISDWSSDVCSSDLAFHLSGQICTSAERLYVHEKLHDQFVDAFVARTSALRIGNGMGRTEIGPLASRAARDKVMALVDQAVAAGARRSEEHTSELQSLMRISYAVFCLKKKKKKTTRQQ